MSVAGIVLAAGASSRAGFPKALAKLGAKTFAELSVEMLAGLDEVVVVVGAPHGPTIRSVLGVRAVHFAENRDPARGMLSSLQAGLAVLSGDVEAAVVALIDHPRVAPATIVTLVNAWRRTQANVVRPISHGHGGHPVVISRPLFAHLLAAPPTASTRDELHRIGRVLDLEVLDTGVIDDLDTAEDIERARAAVRKSG
jgi:molybdenum cofactor cytidylyltransferase